MKKLSSFILWLFLFGGLLANDNEEVASRLNDEADIILAQPILPENYAETLLAELDLPEKSFIWKNYILQKLDVLYLHPDIEPEMQQRVLSRLWKESRRPIPTFAGTSLMTLLRLHEVIPKIVTSDKLAERSQWVLKRPAYSDSDRLSALHVLSDIDYASAAQIAREWIESAEISTMLQQTALNILGNSSVASDRDLIKGFVDHPDLRLRTAAKQALATQVAP